MTYCGVDEDEEEEEGWELMERDWMSLDGGVWSGGDCSAIGSEDNAMAADALQVWESNSAEALVWGQTL